MGKDQRDYKALKMQIKKLDNTLSTQFVKSDPQQPKD